MDTNRVTKKQKSVLKLVKQQDFTSSEILKRTNNIPNILILYTVLEELRSKGLVESYISNKIKYHCVA